MHFHAVLAGVVQQHLVESATLDLPGLGARSRLRLGEVERHRRLAVLGEELHRVFVGEAAALQLIEHAESLERPVGGWHERLANAKARKLLALEK